MVMLVVLPRCFTGARGVLSWNENAFVLSDGNIEIVERRLQDDC